MAIDIHTETLLSFSQAARQLPPSRSGRPVHVSTIWRWVNRGVAGVKLEHKKIGGRNFVSLESLQKFTDALTEQSQTRQPQSWTSRPPLPDQPKQPHVSSRRDDDHQRRIEQELARRFGL